MKSETKVGLLFIVTIGLVVAFAYYLGAISPFSNSNHLYLAYNFAGGIEVGSPVRVMGIKVGKVKAIEFKPEMKMPDGEEVKLRVKISVDKAAWKTIRKDSEFFINLAGVIGEKFIEVSPGSTSAELFKVGETIRGQDPPRIDQLISQSYGLAGKVIDFIEKNEGSVMDTIGMMNKLVVNLNRALRQINKFSNKGESQQLLKNLVTLSSDMVFFTQQMRGEEAQETIALMNKLIKRLEGLDAKAIKKFLQEEGIKAKLF